MRVITICLADPRHICFPQTGQLGLKASAYFRPLDHRLSITDGLFTNKWVVLHFGGHIDIVRKRWCALSRIGSHAGLAIRPIRQFHEFLAQARIGY